MARLPDPEGGSHRAAAAVFAPRSTDIAPIVPPAPVATGRVLPVLVVEPPLNTEPRDELSAASDSRREARAADRATRTPKDRPAPRKSRILTTPPTAAQTSVVSDEPLSAVKHSAQSQPDNGAKASKLKPAPKRTDNVSHAKAHPPRASARPANNKPVALREKQPAPSPKDVAPVTLVMDRQVPSSKMNEAAPRVRKRAILERYVYQSAPKPGERWKSRLRGKR